MDKAAPEKKAADELDKFKRRLIRAVARLLLTEKKPEEQIWVELKKETGCDCELLWTRMRALTVKKLDRLLAANDCMDAVPAPARMSFTDWLLFDLVLVHQKIDLIGQTSKANEDPPVLMELVELVKKFRIEFLRGDDLADAWSSATLYYNNKGHHCSPMLLQRRWYQLKVTVRLKFYEFWYAYRGNSTRVKYAQPYRPTPLQTEIARTFKLVILEPFRDWEDLIKDRLVIMPDEFERKMKERSAVRRPQPKSNEDVPDLVMIEPRIETIDLRLEPDDYVAEGNRKEDESPVPPLVRIKKEPIDIDDDETQIQTPKKSMYEEVLESTHLENEQLDNIHTALYDGERENDENEVEEQEDVVEITARDEDEESVLPQITNVFGNVSDTSVLANIDESRVYCNVENTEVSGSNDTNEVCNVADINVCGNEQNIALSSTMSDTNVLDNADGIIDCDDDDEIIASSSEKDTDIIDKTDENRAFCSDKNITIDNYVEYHGRDDNKDTGVCSEDIDTNTNILTNVEDNRLNLEETSPGSGDYISERNDINEINDDDNTSRSVEETSPIGNVIETNDLGTENVPNIDVLNAQTTNAIVNDKEEVAKDTESTSHSVVITDSDDDNHNIVDDLVILNTSIPKDTIVTKDINAPKNSTDQSMDVDPTPQVLKTSLPEPANVSYVNTETAMTENNAVKKVEIDIKPDIKGFTFGELPNDISFVDEGIEFADDGIMYVDEDSHIDTENKIKKEKEETDDCPTIDEKLLMVPTIFTTRLDDMNLFLTHTFHHIKGKRLLDAIALKSKPVRKETYHCKEAIENVTSNYCGETIKSDNSNTTEFLPHNVSKTISVTDHSNIVMKTPVNDSIIIKKEPVIETIEYVSKYNIPIEQHVPDNDGNVTSDVDDCDGNVIDESQKVKPTSYLLQKPRSRKYNPIQLCKNPDFNTRLKRLNVGFFSSPRNRVLIKSCKPLTIDLSKAFESKLISGTLYLKPSDHNGVQEIVDDTESQNVSVLPSAMPAQSLINNSKVADILPMLRQCLETSKSTENIGLTTERNKVINLPDITEIRRINQRLLTAEVTPIQVQNNQPQVPVTIITSINTPTYPSSKSINISETDNLRVEATDSRGPPKLLDITEDSPSKSSTEHISSRESNTVDARGGFRRSEPVKPVSDRGRLPRLMNSKRLHILQKPVAWKPRELRPEIPWLSKKDEALINSRMYDETLLTLDSLNKMLFLLTDKLEPDAAPVKKLKPKKKIKNTQHNARQTKQRRERMTSLEDPSCILDPSKEDSTSEGQITKCQMPKINIKSATNYPPDKDKISDADTDQCNKKVQYCCWARQKMLQLLFGRDMGHIPRHECPKLCDCCCRNLLKDYLVHDQKMKNAELRIIKGTADYTASLTKESWVGTGTVCSKPVTPGVEKLLEISVETPGHLPNGQTVQVSGEHPVLVLDGTGILNVDASTAASTTYITENEPIDVDAMDTDDNVPVLGGEVFVKTTAVIGPLGAGLETPVNEIPECSNVSVPLLQTPNTQATNKQNQCVSPEKVTQTYQYTHCVTADNLSGGVIINSVTKTPSTVTAQTISSPPSLTKILTVKKSNAPNKFKTIMPAPSKFVKPTLAPKVKEKMIFLNSKQISDKPSKLPVFLGKNKILLTTIKFPPNLKVFKQAKDALKPILKIPKGVHLILLLNGTVSYHINHNVAVKATDLSTMPAIISAVRARMSELEAQETPEIIQNIPSTLFATESEVVDLVDDDDESSPNSTEIENNQTPLVDEVQTTEQSVTINSVDLSDDDTQKEVLNKKEENRAEPNVSGNLIATETENTQDASSDKNTNTIIDIQENVQESTKSDMPLALTEQLKDQLGPTTQNVNAEVDDLPEPSGQTESTDTQELLVEQVQDQSNSSHSISTVVQNQCEQTAHNINTAVPEESSTEPIKNTKNILSDLMEMSGIFDEDMTPALEETVPAQSPGSVALTQPIFMAHASVPELEPEPAFAPVSITAPPLRPVVPAAVKSANTVPPKLSSPVGELTPITSLYELKYACANKGVFFKLDFETGLIVPINVCVKPTVKKPTHLPPRNSSIAPKSVMIDLTDDDDKPEQTDTEPTNTEPVISPGKRSLLLVNNALTDRTPMSGKGFSGPVKPVKLFKALKPSILQRLNMHKKQLDSQPFYNNKFRGHKIKRKQFLKKINLNADPNLEFPRLNFNVQGRKYTRTVKMDRNLINLYKVTPEEPTPMTVQEDLNKELATRILSDDDSDDEPLAKIAKRNKENINDPETDTKVLEDNQNAPEVPKEIELELAVPDNTQIEPEAPIKHQVESEMPVEDAENDIICDNDLIDQEAPFGFDVNESDGEDEVCILGV